MHVLVKLDDQGMERVKLSFSRLLWLTVTIVTADCNGCSR